MGSSKYRVAFSPPTTGGRAGYLLNVDELSLRLLSGPAERLMTLRNAMFSVEDVTSFWQCHRVTVLRLMRRGTLVPIDWKDGEPRFDRSQVVRLKNRRIAIYPHLTVSR